MNDAAIDDYFLALGAKDVGPEARYKLRFLLKHYRENPHPFTSCYNDNVKRFGTDGAARVCATLKDIIEGTTHWRHGGGHQRLSEPELMELLRLGEEVFMKTQRRLHFESAAAAGRGAHGTAPSRTLAGTTIIPNGREAPGDAMRGTQPPGGFRDAAPNSGLVEGVDYSGVPPSSAGYREAESSFESCAQCAFFVAGNWGEGAEGEGQPDGMCNKYKAAVDIDMVSNGFTRFLPQSYIDANRNGDAISSPDMGIRNSSGWGGGTNAGTGAGYIGAAQGDVAELFLEGGIAEIDRDRNLVWKTMLRTGEWATTPAPDGSPIMKPLRVVRDGRSDPENGIVSLSELFHSFKDGAVEHVTVPTSHSDKLLDNTGFVDDVEMRDLPDGRTVLVGGHRFTEPEVHDKVLNGTIANSSAGIVFDYVRKRDGKKFGAAILHNALTNRPWIDGMEPFGAQLSERGEEGRLAVFRFDETRTKPYGDIAYADTGFQTDGVCRLPIDIDEHIDGSWKLINMSDNAAKYNRVQLAAIRDRIIAAATVEDVEIDAKAVARFDRMAHVLALGEGDRKSKKHVDQRGGKKMSELAIELGMTEDEIREAVAERAELKRGTRTVKLDQKIEAWEKAGVDPAVAAFARRLILSDDGGPAVLMLSEDGVENTGEKLTVTEMVTQLVEMTPGLKLTENKVTTEMGLGEKPLLEGNDQIVAPLEERVAAAHEWLGTDEKVPAPEAVA